VSQAVPSIRYRAAAPADAAALGSLHVASWHETYAGLLPAPLLAALSAQARAAMWSAILADPASHAGAAIFLAEDASGPIGFAACADQSDRALKARGYGGEIGAVYVLRSGQGAGVGTALMAQVAGALLDRGHAAAALWVLRDNHPARAFYEKLGGEPAGEREEAQFGATLTEVAYGWRDLSRLARPAAFAAG
jgi:GNAT superfamily N-acetyltransferase